jgi:hypothetical protein
MLKKLRETPWEILFVQSVTAIIWFFIAPFAPLGLVVAGWLPITCQRVALALGCMLIVTVPLAAPQGARPQVTREDINRLEKTDEKLFMALERTRLLQEQQHAELATHLEVSALREQHQTDDINENRGIIRDISEKIDRVTVVLLALGAFLGFLIRYKEVMSVIRRMTGSNGVGVAVGWLTALFKNKVD